AERFGGLQVDDQLELGLLLNRQIGWLVTFDDASNVDPDLPILIGNAAAVAHQPAGDYEIAKMPHRRHRMPKRLFGKQLEAAREKNINAYDERSVSLFTKR